MSGKRAQATALSRSRLSPLSAVILEHKDDLRLVGPGLKTMCSAEGREEIIHCLFIGDVNGRELELDSFSLRIPQQVIRADADVEHISRRDPRRIVIGIRRSRHR